MRPLSLMVSAALLVSLASTAIAQERRAAIPRSAVRAGGGQTGGDGGQGQRQGSGQAQRQGSGQRQDSGQAQGQGSARAQTRPPDRAAAAPPSVRTGQGARARQQDQEGGNPTPIWRNQGGLGSDMVFTQQNPQAVRRVDPVSRPRGGAPPVGVAVPRPAGVRPGPGPRIVYAPYGQVYSYYAYPRYIYAYPRHIYPYGFGAFGLGYFYYNPYGWHPYYAGSVYYQGGAGGYDRYESGELRIEASPRTAEVWVDGFYAGIVDDFDGAFQSLRLEPGPHQIELVAPGYEPLVFDVRIVPGRKITYRGDLRR